MSRHDANRLTYDEVTIFGVPALFTDLRVDRSKVQYVAVFHGTPIAPPEVEEEPVMDWR